MAKLTEIARIPMLPHIGDGTAPGKRLYKVEERIQIEIKNAAEAMTQIFVQGRIIRDLKCVVPSHDNHTTVGSQDYWTIILPEVLGSILSIESKNAATAAAIGYLRNIGQGRFDTLRKPIVCVERELLNQLLERVSGKGDAQIDKLVEQIKEQGNAATYPFSSDQ